jgi:hypothetical protein
MTRTYHPETHDPILKSLHAGWKLTDNEIAERLQLPLPVVREQRERLGLKANRPLIPEQPPSRPDALAIAAKHLRGFDREKMTYWDRPIKLDDVMRKANAVLVRKGLEPVLYCERWKPE